MDYKIVSDYPLYRIYPNGTIYSLHTLKYLKQSNGNNYGHKCVNILNKHGIIKRNFVHRLVMFAFAKEKYFPGAEVDHIDFNPSNNNLDNLEWVTRQENQLRSVRAGRQIKSLESNKSRSIVTSKLKQKLCKDEICKIQKIMDKMPVDRGKGQIYTNNRGLKVKKLAFDYVVSISVINRIARRDGIYA